MGGGGNNDAQKQAEQNERERQAQIAQSTAKINALFADPKRQQQYDKLASDTTAFYTQDLDRQNEIAARKLKFALARSGNAGGSLQADEGKVLGQDYEKGLIAATQRGQQAAASLQGQDEQSKQSLIAMAQAGLDTTTAGSEAASALRSNLQAGQSSATAQGLGDLFSDLSNTYQNSLDAKNARQGQLYGWGSLFQPLYGAPQQQPSGFGGY